MAEIGPKEAQQRANGVETRKRKLIPYAGKPPGGTASEHNYGKKPAPKRQRKARTRKMKLYARVEK